MAVNNLTIGSNTTPYICLGSNFIYKIYLGETLVYERDSNNINLTPHIDEPGEIDYNEFEELL